MIVYIMRGLPGSGKSTKARELVGPVGLVCSTDDFFTKADGKYAYDRSRIREAHAWNQARFRSGVRAKVPRIAVDNTNTLPWQWQPYERFAREHGYAVELVVVDASLTDEELAERNLHGVPLDTIRQMRADLNRPVDVSP